MDSDVSWVDVAALADVPEGGSLPVVVGGASIALFRLDGGIFALLDQCSHGRARLSEGFVEGDTVECPLHQGLICIRTGHPRSAPITEKVRAFATQVIVDRIWVSI